MTKALVFVLAFGSMAAQSKSLEAHLSCNCASWKYSPTGKMVLTTEHVGVMTIMPLTETYAAQILREPWNQREDVKQGYASVVPSFFDSLDRAFVNGASRVLSITRQCEGFALLAGHVACGVNISFPINENARKIFFEREK